MHELTWQQRHISDISKRITRKNKEFTSNRPLTISAQYGLIDQTNFFNKQVASKDLSNYLLLFKGDFAYNKSYSSEAPYGAIKQLVRYKSGLVSSLYFAFEVNKGINDKFVKYYFDSDKWHKNIYENATEGARNHGLLNITAQDFFASKLKLSLNELEQNKIGQLLSKIDTAVTLLQRKKKNYINLKKVLLQKLFPKNKKFIPDVRFKNFTDLWQQRRIKNIAKLEDNKRIPVKASLRKKGSIPYFGANGIQDHVEGFTHTGEHVLIAEDGANSITDYPVYYISRPSWINNHAHVLTARSESDNLYLSYGLKNINYSQYLVGSGRYKLNSETLKKISLMIPSKKEQLKVAYLLSKLDDTITLLQKQINTLTNLKKFLLQNMFI